MLAMPNPELLSTAEAAELLNVSVPTLTRWARDGKIAAHKLPGPRGSYVFTRAAVDEKRATAATRAAS